MQLPHVPISSSHHNQLPELGHEIQVSNVCADTTGLALFAECRIHAAKALLHSAKSLPSVALGKPRSVKKVTAKTPLPSVFFRALGKVFAECQKALGKLFETRLEKQRLKIAKHFIFTR